MEAARLIAGVTAREMEFMNADVLECLFGVESASFYGSLSVIRSALDQALSFKI